MDIRIATAQLNMTSMLTAATGTRASSGLQSASNVGSTGGVDNSSTIVSITGNDPTGINKLLAGINQRQELYTKQLAALQDYQNTIGEMGVNASKLGELTGESSAQDIKSALRTFADQYNQMVDNQAANFADGGLYDDLDAAEYARFAMEREVDNVFNGSAKLGFGGLANAGISIDPETKKMVIDDAQLDTMLARDKGAVMSGVQDLASRFKTATDVYTADGKFLSNRIDRLQDALAWIEQNKPGIEAQAAAANGGSVSTDSEQYRRATPTGKKAISAYGAVAGM